MSQLAIVENVRRALAGEQLCAPADELSVAVMKLREERDSLQGRIAELEGEQLGEPEVLPCPMYPEEAMVVCPQSLRGGPAPGESDCCAEAAKCHGVLKEKAPGLVHLYEHGQRVGAPT